MIPPSRADKHSAQCSVTFPTVNTGIRVTDSDLSLVTFKAPASTWSQVVAAVHMSSAEPGSDVGDQSLCPGYFTSVLEPLLLLLPDVIVVL